MSKIHLLPILLCLISCSHKTQEKITLKKWLAMKNKTYEIEKNDNLKCDSLEKFYSELKNKEFKNRLLLDLGYCHLENGEKEMAKEYLRKLFATGRHISWIDSTSFSPIYKEVKKEYPELRKKFWSQKDTSYFQKMEKMVALDQALVGKPKERHEAFKKHTDFLLDYSERNGFPWQPKGIYYFKKSKFRTGINPSILAIHAPIKKKIKLRKYAIRSAEEGKNSWGIPISLGVTFYTQLPSNAAKPIRFVYFDEANNIKLQKSYLQLYCIKKYMEDNAKSKINLYPAKANSLDSNIIKKQLKVLKTQLVKEFSFDPKSIQLFFKPNPKEKNRQDKGKYNYTFLSFG